MMLSQEDKRRIELQLDSFCKAVLRNYARDLSQKRKLRIKKEALYAEFPDLFQETASFESMFENCFTVRNISIRVQNDALTEALRVLPERKRLIILLFYFLGMNDREISEYLHSFRTTIQDTRRRTLKEMRELLEKQKKATKGKAGIV